METAVPRKYLECTLKGYMRVTSVHQLHEYLAYHSTYSEVFNILYETMERNLIETWFNSRLNALITPDFRVLLVQQRCFMHFGLRQMQQTMQL